mmetsp:Transcript_8504/g.20516  ORF Transcript_8504/g.20516 Transcript_8504/m.20516 type:complete len:141 (-) Transcript_8504:319-741(-)|eukprot:CAMPEP_0178998616 /NCGR_PEP_ID=MMETSP0795-20121207/9608_1 /TAXON_ID=88552 /ORGANISM="Amoebophrya sp., Strain Ameob2" /LENGTH=140 /DNA_ID=CAMNT_0020691307 /DNA_START=150 /DNA_END=572 /DNA_ORIENTATION=-
MICSSGGRRAAFAFVAASLSLVDVARAVLPPGYEDELFCPPGYCKVEKQMDPGFCGPASAFVECFHPDSNDRKKPVPWGSQSHSPEDKEGLLQSGHTSENWCAEDVVAKYKSVASSGAEASVQAQKNRYYDAAASSMAKE